MGAVVEVFASAARTLTVFTDGNGYYSASGLRPGIYNLRVSAPSFLPAIRERVDLRAGVASVVNLTLSTIFDTLNVIPRSDATQGDDWQWMLRSMAHRPILRVVDPQVTAERRDPVMKAGISFVAGSDSQGYGGGSDAGTHFSFEHIVLSL